MSRFEDDGWRIGDRVELDLFAKLENDATGYIFGVVTQNQDDGDYVVVSLDPKYQFFNANETCYVSHLVVHLSNLTRIGD